MKLHSIAAACAALSTLSLASAAFAAEPVTVKLQAPIAAKTKVVLGGAVFSCEADACVAGAASSQTYSLATCKSVAGKFGPVAAFTSTKSFDDARLADCNASVRGTELAKK